MDIKLWIINFKVRESIFYIHIVKKDILNDNVYCHETQYFLGLFFVFPNSNDERC